MAKGTYTDRAYAYYKLWSFKPCQPSLTVPCMAVVSLLDGQCFLLAHGSTEDYVGGNGWVAFLPQAAADGAVAPARMSHDSFMLALLDGPMRAG